MSSKEYFQEDAPKSWPKHVAGHAFYITVNLHIYIFVWHPFRIAFYNILYHSIQFYTILYYSHSEGRIRIFMFFLFWFLIFSFFHFLKDFCRDAAGSFVAAAAILHDTVCLLITQELLCRISVERCFPLAQTLPPFPKT